jgi:hypothetical protein
MRGEANAAMFGTEIDRIYILLNTVTTLWPSWGPELSPGKGVLFAPDTVNLGITGKLIFNEV